VAVMDLVSAAAFLDPKTIVCGAGVSRKPAADLLFGCTGQVDRRGRQSPAGQLAARVDFNTAIPTSFLRKKSCRLGFFNQRYNFDAFHPTCWDLPEEGLYTMKLLFDFPTGDIAAWVDVQDAETTIALCFDPTSSGDHAAAAPAAQTRAKPNPNQTKTAPEDPKEETPRQKGWPLAGVGSNRRTHPNPAARMLPTRADPKTEHLPLHELID